MTQSTVNAFFAHYCSYIISVKVLSTTSSYEDYENQFFKQIDMALIYTQGHYIKYILMGQTLYRGAYPQTAHTHTHN